MPAKRGRMTPFKNYYRYTFKVYRKGNRMYPQRQRMVQPRTLTVSVKLSSEGRRCAQTLASQQGISLSTYIADITERAIMESRQFPDFKPTIMKEQSE